MSNFVSPGRLWLLLLPLALLIGYVVVRLMAKRRIATRYSNVELLRRVAPRSVGWRRHVVAGLVLFALCFTVIASARPRAVTVVADHDATIMLAIDVSLSMDAHDVDPSRLRSAQAAARRFVKSLPAGIQVGLVTFSGTARVVVSPTDDAAELASAIDNLELGRGTAIGDAVELSVDVLRANTASTKPSPTSTTVDSGTVPITPGGGTPTGGAQGTPNAAVVVLSDGSTTQGLPTESAGPIAREANIPVWTIAYGTSSGTIELPNGQQQPVPVDPEPLKRLAEATGGKSFEASSVQQLNKIYDQLKGVNKTHTRTTEISWRWSLAAMFTLMAAACLATWWFHRML